jgi:hypothetical protein
MQYALLIYDTSDTPDTPDPAARPADGADGADAARAVLARPYVTGWARLHAAESARTIRASEGRMLLTDGPFIDSKEFLAGLILIEADNLDGALAVAQEMLGTRAGRAIEVRAVRAGHPRGA